MLKSLKLASLNFNTAIIVTIRAVLLFLTCMELYSSIHVQLLTFIPLLFLFILLISDRFLLGFYREFEFKRSKLFVFYIGMVFLSLFIATSSPDIFYEKQFLNGKSISILFLALVFSNDISDYFQRKLSVPSSFLALVVSLYFININTYEHSDYFYFGLVVIFLMITYLRIIPIGDTLLFTAVIIFVYSLNIEIVFLSIFFFLALLAFVYSRRFNQEVPLIPMISTPLAFAYASPNFSIILGV